MWPLKAYSYIAILHACALTFSNSSLKVVFLCLWAAQALQERPAEWLHRGSPQSDLQSYCIKRTLFITALRTNLFYLLHGEHNPSSNSSASPFTLKGFPGTIGSCDLWNGSLLLGCFERWKWYSGPTESLISLWSVCTGPFKTQGWAGAGRDRSLNWWTDPVHYICIGNYRSFSHISCFRTTTRV